MIKDLGVAKVDKILEYTNLTFLNKSHNALLYKWKLSSAYYWGKHMCQMTAEHYPTLYIEDIRHQKS